MRLRADLVLIAASVAVATGTLAHAAPARSVPSADATPPPELAESDGPSGTAGRGDERYDHVGLASGSGDLAGEAIAGAHRILPIGSIAEVTSIETGRTILVRIVARGPSDPRSEIDVTPGAARLLGLADASVPVRVRAITASASDAAALARGEPASPRMDAPPVLLAALRRQIRATPAIRPTPPRRAIAAVPKVAPLPKTRTAPVRAAAAPVAVGRYVVQVAAFSTKDRATGVARTLSGSVQPVGTLWRVRLGPYPDRAAAQRGRDAAARRGYAGAQIVPAS